MPGFRTWLTTQADELKARPDAAADVDAIACLNQSDWHNTPALTEQLRRTLTPLAAWYLAYARNESEAADPVARFHLGNGARLERLNWLADMSPRALKNSAGMMVNYLYRLEDVENNHEMYVREQKVAASRTLLRIADECPLAPRRT